MADTVEPREDRGESKSRKKNQGHSVLASNQETRRTGLPLREMRLIFFPVLLPFFLPLLFFPFLSFLLSFRLSRFFRSSLRLPRAFPFTRPPSLRRQDLPFIPSFHPTEMPAGVRLGTDQKSWPGVSISDSLVAVERRVDTAVVHLSPTITRSSRSYYGKGDVNWRE